MISSERKRLRCYVTVWQQIEIVRARERDLAVHCVFSTGKKDKLKYLMENKQKLNRKNNVCVMCMCLCSFASVRSSPFEPTKISTLNVIVLITISTKNLSLSPSLFLSYFVNLYAALSLLFSKTMETAERGMVECRLDSTHP